MKRYKVEYEFKYADADISDGKYHIDYLDNNGCGFTFDEAEHIASELRASVIQDTKWVEIQEMKIKYETYRTATGWHIRTRDTRYTEREAWLYVSKVHRDGTYSFMMDYTYAKDFSEKTAKKHLAILNNNQIHPLSLQ